MGWVDMAGKIGAWKKAINKCFSIVIVSPSSHHPKRSIWHGYSTGYTLLHHLLARRCERTIDRKVCRELRDFASHRAEVLPPELLLPENEDVVRVTRKYMQYWQSTRPLARVKL
jgi:hypothetical protein